MNSATVQSIQRIVTASSDRYLLCFRLVVKSSQSESKSSRHKSKYKSSPLKSRSKSKSGIQCPNQCFW